jgi:hypothetical protein
MSIFNVNLLDSLGKVLNSEWPTFGGLKLLIQLMYSLASRFGDSLFSLNPWMFSYGKGGKDLEGKKMKGSL